MAKQRAVSAPPCSAFHRRRHSSGRVGRPRCEVGSAAWRGAASCFVLFTSKPWATPASSGGASPEGIEGEEPHDPDEEMGRCKTFHEPVTGGFFRFRLSLLPCRSRCAACNLHQNAEVQAVPVLARWDVLWDVLWNWAILCAAGPGSTAPVAAVMAFRSMSMTCLPAESHCH